MIKKERLPILFLVIICLLTGIWSGLNRIGWALPLSNITAHHGMIMVGSFLGTLIILEKIIPLKHKSLYLIPLFNLSSIIFIITGYPKISVHILVASSVALAIVFIYYLQQHRSIIYALMLSGSLWWLVGNIMLATTFFYPSAFPWWAAFTLFIISAERIELMKFLPVSKTAKSIFVALLLFFIIGILISFHGIGNLICGSAFIGIAVWLLKYDVVGTNLKKTGMIRYVSIALLTGYIALFLSGVFLLTMPDQWLSYDILVHSFFLGFVFAMIFAHGPMILPGVLGILSSPYHKILYYWLVLLHTSWILRMFADLSLEMELRKISGLLSAIALIGYFISMGVLIIKSKQHATIR